MEYPTRTAFKFAQYQAYYDRIIFPKHPLVLVHTQFFQHKNLNSMIVSKQCNPLNRQIQSSSKYTPNFQQNMNHFFTTICTTPPAFDVYNL